LEAQGVSQPAAEAFARMLPFVTRFPYPFTASRAARYLERNRQKTVRWFEELEQKGYMRRLEGYMWEIEKDVLNGKV
jgi:hypothetical protein